VARVVGGPSDPAVMSDIAISTPTAATMKIQ
jgi:hypothetical protein